VDEKMRNMIHDGDSEHRMELHARTRTPGIRDDGMRRVIKGETSLEEVLRVTREG
jgi:general secretion pathway protein E